MKRPEKEVVAEQPLWDPARKSRRRRFGRLARYLIWVSALLVLAAVVSGFLTWSVPTAPFRLHAVTTAVELTLAADTQWVVRSSRWRATPASSADPSWQRSEGGSPDRLKLWLDARQAVQVRRIEGRPARYELSMPAEGVALAVQLDPASAVTAGASSPPLTAASSPLQMRAQRLLFEIVGHDAADDELVTRAPVSALRFGILQGDRVEPGLVSGGLLFLDKPDTELAIYRGTDLRLGDDLDVEVSSLTLQMQGIEVIASGLARDVRLHVATRDRDLSDRSFMPSWYDRLKGRPLVIAGMGFVGLVVATLSLLLSLAGVFHSIEDWLKHHFG